MVAFFATSKEAFMTHLDLKEFLQSSYTAFHAVENVKAILQDNGFSPLSEGEMCAAM